jgi:hypothetical protein
MLRLDFEADLRLRLGRRRCGEARTSKEKKAN